MAETMKDYEAELEASFKKIEEGDILTGTVVSVDDKEIIKSSAVSPLGTKDLEDRIAAMFFAGSIENTSNNIMVTNARHIGLLKQAETALDAVLEGIETGMPVDLVQIDMTRAWDLLGEITGDSYQDELLDQLFSQFCLGK